jgi:DNA-binding transcriptional ArsR family regulator
MIYLKGHLARPLDAILSAPSRLSILRELARARSPLSGRALARLAGINHQGAAVALADLAKLGLVERRPAGRSSQWRLDRRRWLLSELLLPLLEKENEHADGVADMIKKALRGKAAAILLAGAAAKGRLEPGQAIEVIAVEGPSGRRALGEAVRELTTELSERWSLKLDVRVLTRREALRAVNVEDLWELSPTEGPPSFYVGINS